MSAEFTFVFVAMGQGDCCMVRCPDGKIVVVDCGNKANPHGDLNAVTDAKMLLRAPKWAGRTRKIDALILTHPDVDHCNRVVEFFRADTVFRDVSVRTQGIFRSSKIHHTAIDIKLSQIDIDVVYFSSSAGNKNPLGNYKKGNYPVKKNIRSHFFNTRKICEVTINDSRDERNEVKMWEAFNDFEYLSDFTGVDGKRHTLFADITEEHPWSVSIIAGNVLKIPNLDGSASEDNARSLVTLFQIDGKKALLCGDMTFSTEAFLRRHHEDLLTDVDLVQIPHHGSCYASHADTIDMLNPKAAVCSAGLYEHQHRHPRYYPVLRDWLETIHNNNSDIGLHSIDYWIDEYNGKPITYNEINQTLAKWEEEDIPFESSEKGTFHSLDIPTPDDFILACYINSRYGYYLYREELSTNVTTTSQGNQVYTLDEAGVHYQGTNI